jgi:hypothetical protein
MTARRLLAAFRDFWIDVDAPFCMISHKVIEIDLRTLYDGAAIKNRFAQSITSTQGRL